MPPKKAVFLAADGSKVDGESRTLLWRVNDMLDAIVKPLNVTEKYIGDLSKGLIPPIITDDYNGDFNNMKNDLNAVAKMMIEHEKHCGDTNNQKHCRGNASPDIKKAYS